MGTGPVPPAAIDPCVVVGEFAALLSAGNGLPEALDVLTRGLTLRSAVLRSTGGELLGVGGESVQTAAPVRAVASSDGWLEFTVRARGAHVAVLTVQGARPSQVAALRTAAAVLGLALLSVTSGEPHAGEMLEDHQAEQVALADALHDGPMQSLMAARYAAEAVARGGDPAEVRAAVQQAVVELRQQLWQVRPRGSAGLVEALNQLSERLVESGRHPLALSGDGADLSGPPAVAAFRVVQEVAASAEGPVAVVLRQTRNAVVVELSSSQPLEPRPPWGRRTSAVGGHLTCAAGKISVTLPVTAALSAPFGQARTSS